MLRLREIRHEPVIASDADLERPKYSKLDHRGRGNDRGNDLGTRARYRGIQGDLLHGHEVVAHPCRDDHLLLNVAFGGSCSKAE